MDIYYYLKDELLCQDCKIDLKFKERTGAGYYTVICIACGCEYEIELMTKLKKGKTDEF